MATSLKSQAEYYTDWQNAVQAINPELTDFSDGSELDALGGATSVAGNEFSLIISNAFNNTFFETADGPEITGGPDNLQSLAVDHFGPDFARPGPQPAEGVVTFSRPNTNAGNVTISTSVIVKNPPDANGNSQRYQVQLQVILVGLTINASVSAVVGGADSNQTEDDVVTVIETPLTDSSVTVSNPSPFVGGSDTLDDSAYREFIYDLIASVRGATLSAIEAKALTVPGVVNATGIETERVVIQWDIATSTVVGPYFYIPYAVLYIADANGSADAGLVASVQAAINSVRSAGVQVQVIGATADQLSWTASLTFNPGGPNFDSLSVDPSPIQQSMSSYIAGLPIGTGFIRSVANAAIMAIWGPSGTNDLTMFVTDDPVGDVSGEPTTKLVPGTMAIQ